MLGVYGLGMGWRAGGGDEGGVVQAGQPMGLDGFCCLGYQPPSGDNGFYIRLVGMTAGLLLPLLTLWTQVNEAFEELEDGNEDALKLVWEKQKAQLRSGPLVAESCLPARPPACMPARSHAWVWLLSACGATPSPHFPSPSSVQRSDRADQR